jgi:hypothetical protein
MLANNGIRALKQHPTEMNMPEAKLSPCGAGMTFMFLAEPPLIAEYGPSSVMQVIPHVACPYGKSLEFDERKFP